MKSTKSRYILNLLLDAFGEKYDMTRDTKLIADLKAMTDEYLIRLNNTSIKVQFYYNRDGYQKGVDREIYIQSEIKKEQNRRNLTK